MSSRLRVDDWRYTTGLVSGGHFFSHFYILALPPLFPVLGRTFELTNAELGIVVSVLSGVTLLQVVVGDLVDRVGSKWVLVTGIALTSVGIALVAIAESYLAILAFVAISGLGQSTFHPADYAILDAVTDSSTEGKGFGAHTFSGYAGFAAAPFVVDRVRQAFGWRVALLSVGSVGALYALVLVFLLDPVYLEEMDEDRAEESTGSGIRNLFHPALVAFFAFFVVLTLAGKGVQTFTTILVVENFALSESTGNLALTVYFTAAATGILAGGVLADRYPPRRILGATLTVATLATWVLVSGAFSVSAFSVVGIFAFLGFFVGIVFPSRDRLVSQAAPTGSTGKSFGFVFSGITVGGIVGPVFLGTVIDLTSTSLAFAFVGLFYLGAASIAVLTG